MTVAIALGSNLPTSHGPPRETLGAAFSCIARITGVREIARSSIHTTAPLGPADQPDYANAAMTLHTPMEPDGLLDVLLAVERSFGRERTPGQRWGPRTLDLDIILFGDRTIETDRLVVPHPRMHERLFVLDPLAEIAGGWLVPTQGRTVEELRAILASGPRGQP